MTLAQAAVSAAAVRLRPILMTVLTMVIGMLPLVFASGAGANGNVSLGTGVVGGMIVGTLALLFAVPALFIVFQALEERLMRSTLVNSADKRRCLTGTYISLGCLINI